MKHTIGPELKDGMCIKYEQKLMGALAEYRTKSRDDTSYIQLLLRLYEQVNNEIDNSEEATP